MHPAAPRAVDVFAGAGGLSLGLRWAGFQVVSAVELDAWAALTYSYNHSGTKVFQVDITQLSDGELVELGGQSKVDLLAGGPPCQGFSVAGPAGKDPNDPRNSLFVELVRTAHILQPEVILMENVPGLLSRRTASSERVIDVIQREFEQVGYQTDHRVFNAADYGVPQHRHRLFIVGQKGRSPDDWIPQTSHGALDAFLDNMRDSSQLTFQHFGFNVNPWVTLWEAIGDLPCVDVGDSSEWLPYDRPPLTSYAHWIRSDASGVANHIPMHHTRRMIERFKQVPVGHNGSAAGDGHQPRPRLGSGQHYDQNNRRQDPNKPCATIAASFYANFLHPYLHRNFTPREGARIQSFPDTYKFFGKATVVSDKLLAREGRHAERHLCQYNQIGNAVPPLLGEAIGRQIRGGCLEY